MEISASIAKQYRHWHKHIQHQPKLTLADLNYPADLLKQIEDFAAERMNIWYRKNQGHPPPYSSDNILVNYRFCNIYRELDKQTLQIHHTLNPYRQDFNLWLLNLAFNRFLCRPQTFNQVGLLNFSTNNNHKVYTKLSTLPKPKYGSAYVFPISVIQKSQYPTRELFFTRYLPQIIPEVANQIQQLQDSSVVDGLARILPIFGYNMRFHWTEILIDVAYQFPEKINLYKEFPIGPGSQPTIKLLSPKDPQQIVVTLANTKLSHFPYLAYKGQNIYLSAENWEGIGCEFRKYQNLLKGTGRKRIYRDSPI